LRSFRDLIRHPQPDRRRSIRSAHIAGLLHALGADVTVAEPDVPAMFRRFPDVAQYPTHWQHDLILPYAELADLRGLAGERTAIGAQLRQPAETSWALSRQRRRPIADPQQSRRHRDGRAARQVDARSVRAEIANGIMYGRGTSDMKGGAMAALMALTYLHEAGVKMRGDVIFESVVNEEHAGKRHARSGRPRCAADAAILPRADQQHDSHTAIRRALLACHRDGLYRARRCAGGAARGKDGVSAVENLPPVIAAPAGARALLQREPGAARERAAPFSLVIGKISGGHYEDGYRGEW
jgi:acetylornithine deacetylase